MRPTTPMHSRVHHADHHTSEAEQSFVAHQVNEASALYADDEDLSLSGSATYPEITTMNTTDTANIDNVDDDLQPPHFDVQATLPPKRRSFGASILRRLAAKVLPSNAPPSDEEEEGGTHARTNTHGRGVVVSFQEEEEEEAGNQHTGITDDLGGIRDVEIVNEEQVEIHNDDAEFGTGFLNIESNPSATLSSVGCCNTTTNDNIPGEQGGNGNATAEAVLTVSALTSNNNNRNAGESCSSSGESSWRGNMNNNNNGAGSTNLARLVSRARRALRRGNTAANDNNSNMNIGRTMTAPENLSFCTMTINGEKTIVLTRALTKKDLQDDLYKMKQQQRFANVPVAQGNPPWITIYRPDLIREPSAPLTV